MMTMTTKMKTEKHLNIRKLGYCKIKQYIYHSFHKEILRFITPLEMRLNPFTENYEIYFHSEELPSGFGEVPEYKITIHNDKDEATFIEVTNGSPDRFLKFVIPTK